MLGWPASLRYTCTHTHAEALCANLIMVLSNGCNRLACNATPAFCRINKLQPPEPPTVEKQTAATPSASSANIIGSGGSSSAFRNVSYQRATQHKSVLSDIPPPGSPIGGRAASTTQSLQPTTTQVGGGGGGGGSGAEPQKTVGVGSTEAADCDEAAEHGKVAGGAQLVSLLTTY